MILRFFIAIVLLTLVAGGLVGFNMFRDQAIEDFFANMPVQTVTVSTVTVEEQDWTPSIETIGTVSAISGVDLTVETTGIVREIRFTANQRVEQNEVLVQLDDEMQQADLSAARTQANLDRESLERARELQQRGVGSNVSVQSAEAAATASASQVDKLAAALQQKQLRAPFSGTLGIPRVSLGQYLAPGTSVVTLQDLDTMHADFTVPEQQLPRLRMGQPVHVTVDGIEDSFVGEIIGIDPQVDAASRLVSVRAAIDNPDGRLTPGQFARVAVELPREEGVIALPQTAVVTSLYGDYVFAVRARENENDGEEEVQEVRQVFVGLGRRSGGQVEVASGLEPGDIVVTAGQNRLSNGTPVTVDNTLNPVDGLGERAAAQ